MTTHKHLKARVRSRMAKTGERYAAARAQVAGAPGASPDPREAVHGIRHFPGIHPETTVLRILATHAGIRDSRGEPPTEETMLAVGGGLGAGVFAFHYAKEGFSSLFLAGRHRWEDPLAYMNGAIRRLGLEPTVRETGSVKAAERDLREALATGGPVAAWVDWVELRYRGGRPEWSGGAYHVLAVYAVEGDVAIVGDLAARPIEVPLAVLARARARIVKHRNRLLTVASSNPGARAAQVQPQFDLSTAARAGLHAGAEALASESRRNFSLAAFADLADRMVATSGANSWTRVFPRGRLLMGGLTALHRYVDAYFTGGGLLRPMAARAASEIGGLEDVAARYASLGASWTQLAQAALPDEVPLLAELRRAQKAIAGEFLDRGPGAIDDISAAQERLDDLEHQADEDFPLSDVESARLLSGLAERLHAIHDDEVAAVAAVRATAA